MISDNYVRHFKVLGKLCKLYDDAAAAVTSQEALLEFPGSPKETWIFVPRSSA
jgi:hypothetical protein